MPREETHRARALTALLAGALAYLALHRIPLALGRDFDPDELQHMHGGFSIASGLTPYVDYFEHHAPWLHLGLAGLVHLAGPGWSTLMAGRLAMAAVSLVGLVFTWQLARRFTGRGAALGAVLVQLSVLSNTDKAIEIRPDVPAAVLGTLALAWGVDALRSGSRRATWLGGLALGGALALTPKLAFLALGFGVAALIAAAAYGEARRRAQTLAQYVLASTVAPAATLVLVWWQGHLTEFVRDVVLGPLHWAREVSPWLHLTQAVQRNPLALGAGTLGLGWLLFDRHRERDPAAWVVPAAAGTMIAGWFIVPVPWPQYLLPLWPLVAVGAAVLLERAGTQGAARLTAAGLVVGLIGFGAVSPDPAVGHWAKVALRPAAALIVCGLLGRLAMQEERATWMRTAAGVLGLGLLGAAALWLQPHVPEYGMLWALLAGAIALAPRERRWGTAYLVALMAGPLTLTARLLEERPVAGFRAEFDLIMERTAPEDTVLTGWRGCAVFRPHAYRYFFLHGGVLQMLSEEERGEDVLEALRERPPAAAIRDDGTRALAAAVQRYLDEHYVQSGVGDVWLRR